MGMRPSDAAELISTAAHPQHLTQDAVGASDEHEDELQITLVPALAGAANDTFPLDAVPANAAWQQAAAAGSLPASGGHHSPLGSCILTDASADGRTALAEFKFESLPADRSALATGRGFMSTK